MAEAVLAIEATAYINKGKPEQEASAKVTFTIQVLKCDVKFD